MRELIRELAEKSRAEGRVVGHAEGRVEGRVVTLLALLALKFGPVSEEVERVVRAAGVDQLRMCTARVLTAASADEVIGPLSGSAGNGPPTAEMLLAQGEVRGRAAALLELMALRFEPISKKRKRAVRAAGVDQLRSWNARVLTATSLDEVTGWLPGVSEYGMTTAEMLREEGRAQGKALGCTEGRAAALVELLALKFGPVSERVKHSARLVENDQLDLWTERILTAATVDEVIAWGRTTSVSPR